MAFQGACEHCRLHKWVCCTQGGLETTLLLLFSCKGGMLLFGTSNNNNNHNNDVKSDNNEAGPWSTTIATNFHYWGSIKFAES